ncbi:DUF5366 family protein [Paenalkalicoccus suaedae]|uniref:DUF5366 family protein n=1 Tax=Paenalkalicoccus suaedae TaxID=2592382 RepID=A0A859FD11_9BACI|nr:DUF5366 family protein [Paenalkalicoccus suaedae]QKS70642.1 DUF5366 family protein [Paenalkalicoccus suaedae]
MRNAYLTSHFPLISIILFSLSFSIYTVNLSTAYLQEIGLYSGMVEFFSERGILLTLLFVLWLFYFMLFAALKLIADTINELSLLFFSKDEEGVGLRSIRRGSWFFLIGSIASLVAIVDLLALVATFTIASFLYFIYFLYRVSDSLGAMALFGLVFFHLFFWFSFVLAIGYSVLRLYNSVIASLPL